MKQNRIIKIFSLDNGADKESDIANAFAARKRNINEIRKICIDFSL
ncbi:hypothetical protein ACFLSQ_02960 [Bacteroidota bacterium]